MKSLSARIVKAYIPGVTSLREVSDLCDTNHHMVKRVLLRNGKEIKKGKAKPFTDAHKLAISKATKGRKTWSEGKKMTVECRLKNLLAHSRFQVSYKWAAQFDLEILMMLNRMITPRPGRWVISTKSYKAIVEKFAKDAQFLRIYKTWLDSGKEHYLMPSFDHIHPTSGGGCCSLKNLQVLTWFENRCKNHMPQEEWNNIKNNITKYFT